MSENCFGDDFFFGVKKYRHLLTVLYKYWSYEERYVFIDKSRFSSLVQKRLKTDTIMQKEADLSYGIEEKVARWPANKNKPHTAFFLETRSCTNPGHESPGWMDMQQGSKADYLLYAFEIKDEKTGIFLGLDVFLLDFPCLQTWFYPSAYQNTKYPFHVMSGKNRTEGKLVNIADVVKSVRVWRFFIASDGTCVHLKKTIRIQDYLLRSRINQMIGSLSGDKGKEEEEEETDDVQDWREVQQRVEEILAQQEAEQFLHWVEEQEKQA